MQYNVYTYKICPPLFWTSMHCSAAVAVTWLSHNSQYIFRSGHLVTSLSIHRNACMSCYLGQTLSNVDYKIQSNHLHSGETKTQKDAWLRRRDGYVPRLGGRVVCMSGVQGGVGVCEGLSAVANSRCLVLFLLKGGEVLWTHTLFFCVHV